ncbi:GNAT family N-acetyltransferase [Halomonas sp. PAMB 3232]|uniref:GNAT family N-acetyltransferase n=1 Tax=Halomonas sp. PAMB 3232 TaxID=3075221 RepID=UPI00289AD73A|nr:GNAT family N-acetyltransferase [Halomonas sp. PAMB 3232]WNL39748.1 GNAT family N-acetyltransferase [Halomonas sp. PAMB 3232]
MTDGRSSQALNLVTLSSIEHVPEAQWDALVSSEQPFLRHAFLNALEQSGSASEATGWQPRHLCVWQGERLVAALPLYLKSHSSGEYVFDWGWAEAFERAGGDYYPKALSAVPFTPVPGQRTLVACDIDAQSAFALLARGWRDQCETLGLSSWHLLFANDNEVDAWQAQCPELIVRHGVQFQWRDRGFKDFDGFLESLTAKRRKTIKRERRLVAEQGITLRRLEGEAIDLEALAHFFRCYTITYHERGRPPYLNEAFFQALRRNMPESMLLVQALVDGRPVAAALYFRGATTLYGRYWGSEVVADCLHFEACYYQGIEFCLERGLSLFDPGTQGEHKLVRGFAPTPTRSLHYLAHEGLAAGVAEFCAREGEHVKAYRQAALEALPFKAWP